jgi:hypothetical protein
LRTRKRERLLITVDGLIEVIFSGGNEGQAHLNVGLLVLESVLAGEGAGAAVVLFRGSIVLAINVQTCSGN